ncbi:hypothetical protein C6Q35_05285 [Burkholderia multivorans]|nr:hypothetical protein C6Q35_05285 [Burkholderia multivorans]
MPCRHRACRAAAHLCRAPSFLPFAPPFMSNFDETNMAEIANFRAELTYRLIPACSQMMKSVRRRKTLKHVAQSFA